MDKSGGFKKLIIDVVTTSVGLDLTIIEIVERRKKGRGS